MVCECWRACATGKSHLKKICTCVDVNVQFKKYVHCRLLFLYPIERDCVCVCRRARVHEGEGERK